MSRIAPESKWVLIAVQDRLVRRQVASILGRSGHQLTLADGPRDAVAQLARRPHDAAIVDLEGGVGSDSDPFQEIRSRFPDLAVLVLVEPQGLHEAVRALREGAEDYLVRPPDAFELNARLGRILERHDLYSRLALLQDYYGKNSRHWGWNNESEKCA